MTVAASGDRKSASDRALTLPHSEWERELAAEYKPLLLAFKNRLLAWEKARDKALRDSKGMLEGEAALEALGPATAAATRTADQDRGTDIRGAL